jgi:uncharacterized membrane protein
MSWEIATIMGLLGVLAIFITYAFKLKEDLFVVKWLFFYLSLLGSWFVLIITAMIVRPHDADIANAIESMLAPLGTVILIVIIVVLFLTLINYLRIMKAKKRENDISFDLDDDGG